MVDNSGKDGGEGNDRREVLNREVEIGGKERRGSSVVGGNHRRGLRSRSKDKEYRAAVALK